MGDVSANIVVHPSIVAESDQSRRCILSGVYNLPNTRRIGKDASDALKIEVENVLAILHIVEPLPGCPSCEHVVNTLMVRTLFSTRVVSSAAE